MTIKELMNSGYPRLPDDHYTTVDPRCVYAFLQYFRPRTRIVDVCAPNGSGIVETLKGCGFDAVGVPDAFADTVPGHWVVTNVPYKPVDRCNAIIQRQIQRVMNGEIMGFASLNRWQFDHAVTRKNFFQNNSWYYGQIKTLFRPEWLTDEQKEERRAAGEKEHQPFHPYIWHVWTFDNKGLPVIMWSDGEKYDPEKC